MLTNYDNETVQFRLKYVLEIKNNDKTIAEAARDADVTWKTMKSWIVRFKEHGIFGLLNQPRGKTNSVSDEIKEKTVDIKRINRTRSARKIRDILKREENISLHRQTVWRILKDAGENKRTKKKLKVYRDFERHRPNSLWQIDYMDAIVIEGVGLVYLILILDDHSRKIIGGKFVTERSAYNALKLLWESNEKYGIPSQIYSDQGTQFKSILGKGFSHYERVCKRLAIKVIHGTVRYPEGRGKIERLFGFIQDDFIPEYRFTCLKDMNTKFEKWIVWYNREHEHSTLGGNPPNSRYTNFNPRMPEVDMFEIFSEHFTRKVRKNATISFKGKIYPVNPKYIKEKVIVKAFGDSVKIYSQTEFLGEFDARIDYHEKMLRRVFTRTVKKDGTMKFQRIYYHVGKEHIGKKVEVMVIRDQLRAFLSSNRMIIFKLGESDAVLVGLDR